MPADTVSEHPDRHDVADAEQRVALAQRAPRHRTERSHRLVTRGRRRRLQAVHLPEHHRDRQHFPACRGDDLLEQYREMPFA